MNDTLRPRADRNTGAVVDRSVESLAGLRGLMCPDDPGLRLHLLASLQLQLQLSLTPAVLAARKHGYSWVEIAGLLGGTLDETKARFDRQGAGMP